MAFFVERPAKSGAIKNKNKTDLKEYGDLIYSYFNGKGKKFYITYKELVNNKIPGSEYEDILFKDDIKEWEKSINVTLTVDNAEEGYKGNTGLVTKYIPELEIKDIENTAFVVVGPPIMMKFTVAEILKRGVAEENIWVSYERKMCCGLGKCGHCKMDDTYICLDGPVFNYTKAKNLVD